MPAVRQYKSGRPDKVYRGSRKRVRGITWRDHTSVDVWILLVIVLLTLLVGMPWLIGHPPREDHDAPGNHISPVIR